MLRLCLLFVLVAAGSAQNGAKRPLTHRDYDTWRTIQSPTLSRDGHYLAYGLFPQEGDGELVVRDLKTGHERRETAGALPPPPEPNPEREPGDEPVTSIRILFTADSRFVVFSTFAPQAEADAAKKARKEAPKGGLSMLDLQQPAAAYRVEGVKSFQIPEKGPSTVAYLKEPVAGSATAAAEGSKQATPRPQEPVPAPAVPAKPAKPRTVYGTELVLRDLTEAKNRSFQDATEYSLAKDGKTLVYTASSHDEEANGIYLVPVPSDSPAQALLKGRGKYQKLTWDLRQTTLAFLSDRDEAGEKKPRPALYMWQRNSVDPPWQVVTVKTAGFHSGWVVSEKGEIAFSRDGSRLFFGAGPPPPPERESTAVPDDAVVADLWHFKDPYIQPMQKVRAVAERARSYRAVYHLAAKKMVQLADDSLAGISASDDGRFAIGTDDRAYKPMVDYDGMYTDYYLIDTVTGSRKRLLEKGGAGPRNTAPVYWSPDGERVLFYRDRHWHVVTAADGSTVNLTAALSTWFFNEEEDRPLLPEAYGTAGWTRDGRSVLLYDRYDVWQISADGKTARNVTDGTGRREKTQLRVVRLRPPDDDEPRGINPSEPLLLRAENTVTRDSGFWRDRLDAEGSPVKLVMGARNYRPVAKAKDADVVALTASTFAEFPDLQITSSDIKKMRKVTDANPQRAGLRWGTSELVSFRNTDGVPLQAALYKPDGFNPSKKYPMLIYIYEKLSQGVNSFVDPKPGTSPNIAYYVSNGYLVLTPDIVYTTGHPGASALKCVLPAIEAAVSRGGVDENAIGIAGHSWGGYQVAYLVTQTRRFRAAEAGAPVGNMISAYNGIRWGSGLPRQFQYERAQSRIGGSLWEYPMLFVENSPIFHVRDVHTPMLLIHNDADDAVPWYQGIELYLSLRRNGKEAYLFNYNGEKHGIRKRPNQKDWTVRMQQYFDYYLKGASKPHWMEKGIPYLEREEEKLRLNASDQ